MRHLLRSVHATPDFSITSLTDAESTTAPSLRCQLIKVTNTIDNRVRGVANNVVVVDIRVAGVGERVAGVDDKVAGVDDHLKDVDNKVKAVDDKLVAVIDGAQCVFYL